MNGRLARRTAAARRWWADVELCSGMHLCALGYEHAARDGYADALKARGGPGPVTGPDDKRELEKWLRRVGTAADAVLNTEVVLEGAAR